jgi:homoserine dehydrogenase
MEQEGRPFGEILKDAQALGYAEADPSADIGGYDTAHKLAILTSLAFGTEIDLESVYLEGIEAITPEDIAAADQLGFRIKLLGVALATETGIEQRVHPTMVEKSTAIAQIDGVTNAVAIDGDLVGEVLLVGPGAGGEATASAVIGDLIDIAAGRQVPTLGVAADKLKPARRTRMRAHEGGYYIRLSVYDRPGAFARIAQRMAEQDISLESIVQHGSRGSREGDPRTVILITHETTEARVRGAFDLIKADGQVDDEPRMIRIERT